MITWQTATDASVPTSAQTVVLRKGPNSWLADFSQTEHAAFLRRHFGSAIMPLAFTLDADPIEVFNVIKARNPEYLIHVA